MDADLSFRPVSSSDVADIWELYSETTRPKIEPLLKAGWVDPEQQDAFLSWWKPDQTLVILSEDKTIGWISFYQGKDKLTLEHVCISAAYQQRGFGSAAIGHVLNRHRTGDIPVEIFPLKESPLIRHLEEIGFKRSVSEREDPLTVCLVLS